jgi:hypothetical protein
LPALLGGGFGGTLCRECGESWNSAAESWQITYSGCNFFRNCEDGAEKEQLVQNAADETSIVGNWFNRTHHEEDVNDNPENFTSL